jgi:hypothetical protein
MQKRTSFNSKLVDKMNISGEKAILIFIIASVLVSGAICPVAAVDWNILHENDQHKFVFVSIV